MGFMDKIRALLYQHDDKVDQGLEKAGQMAKEKLPGHDQQIDQGIDQLQQMTGEGDTTRPKPPGEAPPGTPPEGVPPRGGAPADAVPADSQPDVPTGPGQEPPPPR